MSIKVDKRDKYSLVTVEAEKLDGIVSPEMKSQLVMINSGGEKNIIIDMSASRYCDSSGLSAILVGNRLCNTLGGSFIICGVQPTVMKLITISQLDSILKIVPTFSEAEDLLLMEEVERGLDGE